MTSHPLPLSLTPFEESLWVDDHPAYPWNTFFRLRFAGPLERTRFTQAWQAGLDRHPLLRARVRKTWRASYVWEPCSNAAANALHWNEHAAGTWPARKLDLEAGETLEAWVRSDETAAELLVQTHHAAVDGGGAVQFLGDVLAAYHAAAGSAPAATFSAANAAALRRRGWYGYTVGRILRLLPRLSIGVYGIRDFLKRKPAPLVPHATAPREQFPPPPYPSVRAHRFSAAETTALQAAARRQGVRVNDLLTRDLFLTLGAWQRTHGVRDGEWLRIAVPYGMRQAEDVDTPAANQVSLVFLDRNQTDVADPMRLLQSVHVQMNLMRSHHLGLIYLLSLFAASRVPGLQARIARRRDFSSTAIFSNLVRPFESSHLPRDGERRLHAGDAVLESFEFWPPVRPQTCAAYGASTYADRLTLTLHADSRFLAPTQIDELLQGYVERVTATLHESSPCAIR